MAGNGPLWPGDKKPNRKKLIKVLQQLQRTIGEAQRFHGDDRNPRGFELGQKLLKQAHELCIDALSFDPPEK